MEKVKSEVRKNLNDMVKSIGLRLEKNRYSSRSYAKVVFFNDKEIDFVDSENKLYDYLMACRDCGYDSKDIIKSKRLVEGVKTDDVIDAVVDEKKGTYIAVEYVAEVDGEETRFLLFLKRFIDTGIVNLYWNKYQKMIKQNTQK